MLKLKIRVQMEPELEAIAGHLNSADRFTMAKKLGRWMHQLEVTAKILAKPRSEEPKKIRRIAIGILHKN